MVVSSNWIYHVTNKLQGGVIKLITYFFNDSKHHCNFVSGTFYDTCDTKPNSGLV